MSRIYASGVRATAIANMQSDIAAFITAGSDGIKRLDMNAMNAYLIAQFRLLSSTDGTPPSPATTDSVDAAARATNTMVFCNNLNALVRPEVFSGRSDWPQASSTVAGQDIASSVASLQGQLEKLAQTVSDYYAWLADTTSNSLAVAVSNYMDEKNIDATIDQGVVRLVETRAARCTYVTDRGEESAPSPPSALFTLDQNDTATYTAPSPPGGRFVSTVRWYRSNEGTSGAAAWDFVADQPIASGLAFTDTLPNSSLGDPCPSLLWDEPPADLQGLVGGANGGMAGFRNNEFCPCVPYIPYAFPTALRITTEWPIVGLGAAGQTYFVGTRGRPYLITGADTQSLSPIKLEDEQACVSRRSIVAMGDGFVYASPDGLCRATAGGVKVITGPEGFNLFDRDTWNTLLPSSIVASAMDNAYIFHWNNGTTAGTYSLDMESGRLVALTNDFSALFRDQITDRLYYAAGTAISGLFASGSKRTATWRSKRITLPEHESFGWIRAESPDYTAGNITLKVYRDGVLVRTATITSRDPARMPPGISDDLELEVTSAARVTSVTLATGSEELRE